QLGTQNMAARMSAATPARSGGATKRDRSVAFVSVKRAHIWLTAAIGDIVRPAAAASDTTAPTCVGSTPSSTALTAKKGKRLCAVAIPEPHKTAKPSERTPAVPMSNRASEAR